jgi:hypothetical protein
MEAVKEEKRYVQWDHGPGESMLQEFMLQGVSRGFLNVVWRSLSRGGTLVAAAAVIGAVSPVFADTVQARCDVYPKGEDRAKSSGLCTFSQRQGFVGIELKNGKRFDLSPNEQQADAYTDQNGRPVTRELLEGNRGQVYRFKEKSIFVYWDTAPYTP